jgi:hypothetical protein
MRPACRPPSLTREHRLFYTSSLLSFSLGRIEFPTTPIGAVITDGASHNPQSSERASFIQPTLEGLEPEHTPEIELGNCIVTTSVTFRKRVKGNEWHCQILAEPDLLHPEQEGIFEAHATNAYADMAQSYHLRPGDRALLRGTLHPQTIALANGETATINHFFVTSIEVLARSKRTSIMVYEKEQTR